MADKKVKPLSSSTDLINLDEGNEETLNAFALKLLEEENKILKLWQRGIPPKFIKLQFPAYSEQDIINLAQSKFDITSFDFKMLDGALFIGYMDDMQALEKMIENAPKEEKLAIMALKLSARDKTIRFRELIERMYNQKHSPDEEDETDTVTGSLEIRLKRRIQSAKDPAERKKIIEELEALEEEFIEGEMIKDGTD